MDCCDQKCGVMDAAAFRSQCGQCAFCGWAGGLFDICQDNSVSSFYAGLCGAKDPSPIEKEQQILNDGSDVIDP